MCSAIQPVNRGPVTLLLGEGRSISVSGWKKLCGSDNNVDLLYFLDGLLPLLNEVMKKLDDYPQDDDLRELKQCCTQLEEVKLVLSKVSPLTLLLLW